MPKVNTLMSYFSPKNENKPLHKNKNNSIRACFDSPKSQLSRTEELELKEPHSDYKIGDIVWGRMISYPWWPGMVCNDPDTEKHCRLNNSCVEIHLQFFDEPPSRAWIKHQSLAKFEGGETKDTKRGGRFFSPDKHQHKAISQADEAFKLEIDERLKLIVVTSNDGTGDSSHESDVDCEEDSCVVASDESLKENNVGNIHRRKSGRSKTKRRRIKISGASDEDSGDEFKPASSSSDSEVSSGVDEMKASADDPSCESEPESPLKVSSQQRKRKKPEKATKFERMSPDCPTVESTPSPRHDSPSASHLFSPQVGKSTKSKLASFTAPDSTTLPDSTFTPTLKHLKFDFLKPENLRDRDKNKMAEASYDPRTLFVPDSFLKDQTPAMRQWWEIKRQRFDNVLFFKMGKFYELFHMDATIAVRELGIIYMKGEYAHAGFPEISYGRYAETLIQRGYKVARIEQMETPDMMDKRLKTMLKPTKFDKVVKREVCRVTSTATKTFSFIDGSICGSQHNYLLAIAEKETGGGVMTYGVCFVDTSIGKFQLGAFSDDRHCSRLRTLLARHPPARVLYERGHSSETTQQIFKHNLGTVAKEALMPRTEFWDSSKTLKRLAEGDYFADTETHKIDWPDCFSHLIAPGDALGLSASDGQDLSVRALGAITWYLEYSLLDQELLSLRNFSLYVPADTADISTESLSPNVKFDTHMVVDGVALNNLDILHNSAGSLEGTLLQQLDQCHTPFGKRLLRQWLCSPLCNPSSIQERLDAIDDLMALSDVRSQVADILKRLPDLERLLSKIHSMGSAVRHNTHPDSRAIFFEEVKYSKRKIEDFLCALSGFQALSNIPSLFSPHLTTVKSSLLREFVGSENDSSNSGQFPDLDDKLQFFENAFDHATAKKNGVIIPSKGVDVKYDRAVDDIGDVVRELDSYLEKQRRVLSSSAVTYWGTGRNRYQLEVPESSWKNVPEEYMVMSSKKGWKRYRTVEIEKKIAELDEAEERKDGALKDTMRTIFHSFDESYALWDRAVQCVSVLDVLMSLTAYSQSTDSMCRPEFVLPSHDVHPFIEIRDGRHPCINDLTEFIPNDTLISASQSGDNVEIDEGCVVIVTGPNMGGKSTLMRQVGLIVILAQLGCHVPAEKCRLTPVDRIFTRLGASDRIMAGESTFFVELSETSAILQHATCNSFVIMDELGRGTATYDGTAIACAVVNELSTQIRCRTLFSTHYHSLVNDFGHDPTVRLGHMSCMVENEEDDPSNETITFLYKFAHGPCPKSYGFNAAKLANVPDNIIKLARKKAQEFEDNVSNLKLFQQLWSADGAEEWRRVQR